MELLREDRGLIAESIQNRRVGLFDRLARTRSCKLGPIGNINLDEVILRFDASYKTILLLNVAKRCSVKNQPVRKCLTSSDFPIIEFGFSSLSGAIGIAEPLVRTDELEV